MAQPVRSDKVATLKHAVKIVWQMENELRYSAWNALTLDQEKAQHHLAEARRHLNSLLDEADPVPQIVDQPPVLNEDQKSNGADT